MVLGVGIDQVETARISRLLDRFGERGERRLFTPLELALCRDRPRRGECLAARFAAKEAFSKAVGTGLRGMKWTDIEVVGGENDRPQLLVSGGARETLVAAGGGRVLVSLTHEAGRATAVVLIEADGADGAGSGSTAGS